VPRAATYSIRVLLARSILVKGKTYVIHIVGKNTAGETATLAIRFTG
jgi:hypothetical protein